MNYPLLLNTLHQMRQPTYIKETHYKKKIRNFLEGQHDSRDVCSDLFQLEEIQENISFLSLIDKWGELLSLLLILHERGGIAQYAPQLIERLRCLNAFYAWDELQLVAVYQALCAHLLGQPAKVLKINQKVNGSVPLEWGGHWSWGAVPHSRFHAELGFLWCLYGQLTGHESLFKAAESLANWQLNTLDHQYLPHVALFSQEEDASESPLLINTFLLFSAVSIFSDRGDMAAIAKKLYAHILIHHSAMEIVFSFLQLAYDKWLSKYQREFSSDLPILPSVFKDEELIMAGCRSESGSVISSLTGGGSGMGCMHREDIQIVNFGPQHLPLGDCYGFGIETQQNHLSHAQIKISENSKAYTIEGIARLSPRPKTSSLQANFRNGDHSGFWIEAKQNFQDEQLSIETIFRGLFDISTLAFAFFVKAQSCAIENLKVVNPRSFERYQGEVKNIILRGERTTLMIEAAQKKGELQVIPLGGGNNFWGADFLVAYIMDSQEYKYSWTIK